MITIIYHKTIVTTIVFTYLSPHYSHKSIKTKQTSFIIPFGTPRVETSGLSSLRLRQGTQPCSIRPVATSAQVRLPGWLADPDGNPMAISQHPWLSCLRSKTKLSISHTLTGIKMTGVELYMQQIADFGLKSEILERVH